jgi:hypothetical protein
MNLDLGPLFTNEIQQTIRIFALVLSMLHLLIFLVFYRRAITAIDQISTPRTRFLVVVMLVHMLLLVGILLLVIFY